MISGGPENTVNILKNNLLFIFFLQRIIYTNKIKTVDYFASLSAFKRYIRTVDFSVFL